MFKRKALLTSLLATSVLVGCGGDNDSDDETGSVKTAAVLELSLIHI